MRREEIAAVRSVNPNRANGASDANDDAGGASNSTVDHNSTPVDSSSIPDRSSNNPDSSKLVRRRSRS
jgi:hypothetical protein